MKIIATISNYGAAANLGGHVEMKSSIIVIDNTNLPSLIKRHIDNKNNEQKWENLTFSLLERNPQNDSQ